jgi:vacuolar protein sorting-associated protein 35
MAAQQQASSGANVPSETLLATAQQHVASIGQQLRRQDGSLEDSILLADKLLQELRTGELSPKQYYELNLRCLEELRYLQSWLVDLERTNVVKMVDLYQRVQYLSAVVPRLYLMCTVGAAYCSLAGSPAKEVMKDMLEMCKCVQHPTRGLFLRNYLSQLTKDKLSQLGGPKDRCEFVLHNFSEMTRLWVRMQPPKRKAPIDPSEPPEDPKEAKKKQDIKEKREVERKQLCQIIGVNLHRLSESVTDLDIYEHTVLPRVLDIIVSSGDAFAQTYLSDVLSQVIPNKFQIATLDSFLETVCGPDMVPGMDLQKVLSSLMDRLAEELVPSAQKKDPEEDELVQAPDNAARVFDSLFRNIGRVCSAESWLPFRDQLALHVALLKFQSRVDARRLDRIDSILGSIAEALHRQGERKLDPAEESCIVDLLRAPFEVPSNGDILGVLQLSKFPELLAFLGFDNRRSVASKLLKAVVISSDKIEDQTVAERLFEFVAPLLSNGDADDDSKNDALFARAIHKFHHEDPNELFKLLRIAKENLQKCKDDTRLVRTLIPLAYRNMELIRRNGLNDVRGCLQLVHSICSQLGNSDSAQVKDTAARVFVYAALAADKANEEIVSYECVVSAFSIFENQADSKLQAALVPFFVGAIQGLTCFGKDNLEILQAKTALYAAQLLKKTDQCRHLALSAHLFWSLTPERQLREGESSPIPGRNGKRALECLQRALKTADVLQSGGAAAGTNKSQIVALFVEILNQYIYFLQAGADKIKPQFITELISLITEQLNTSNPPVDIAVEHFYRRTMAHLKRLSAKGGKFAEFSAGPGLGLIETGGGNSQSETAEMIL